MNNYFNLDEERKKQLRGQMFFTLYSTEECRNIKGKFVNKIILYYIKQLEKTARQKEDYAVLQFLKDMVENKENELEHYGLRL